MNQEAKSKNETHLQRRIQPSRQLRVVFAGIALTVLLAFLPRDASAGVFELSLGFSYNHSNYTEDNFSWNRRWGASVGYHLTELSEIEFSFQDVTDRTKITGFEDTTFHDQIYAFNWVQSITGKNFPIQPYFKVGIGQLNREASGTYAGSVSPPAIVDSVTGILGVGLRLYLIKGLGLRAEANTYLEGGRLSSWQDNVAVTTGISIYF